MQAGLSDNRRKCSDNARNGLDREREEVYSKGRRDLLEGGLVGAKTCFKIVFCPYGEVGL